MRKLSLCLVLLALGTVTFAGCSNDAKKPIPKKPDAGAPAGGETTPAPDAPPATDKDKPAADTPAPPAGETK
jgi:hypothetical protein